MRVLILLLVGIIGLTAFGTVWGAEGDEGFETPETMFTYVATRVSFIVNDSAAAHSGQYSFRVNPSSCGASCFDSYRMDLTHTFDKEVFLLGIRLFAKEGSTSGSGWGGKIRVGHDSTWNFFDSGYDWWGVVGNGHPVTGQWVHEYVTIGENATNAKIRLWDITSRSTLWVDDIVLYYIVDGVVATEKLSWGSVKAEYRD